MMNFEQFGAFVGVAFPKADKAAMERFEALEPLYR